MDWYEKAMIGIVVGACLTCVGAAVFAVVWSLNACGEWLCYR